MATTRSISLTTRNWLLRPIALGGFIIGIAQLIHTWLVQSVLAGNPFLVVLQYLASGMVGNAAFEGGVATALLGLGLHLIVSLVISGVFILSADRMPLLRRYAVPGALLYGFGVFIVMNLMVLPLSAAPPLPAPTLPQLIEAVIEHILVIGLTLGLLVRRDVNTPQ